MQHNVAGLKTRLIETLKRLEKKKIDVVAIQECNFSIKKKKDGQIEHVVPKMKGWNLEVTPRTVGRKKGTDSKGKGGVMWAVKEGVNYERITSSPLAPNDATTEWVGIRIFPEDQTEPLELINLYIPPTHDGDKDDDRTQNFDPTYLPSSFNTLIFADANCHGRWDARGKTSPLARSWEDWADNNAMSILNDDLSYTRKDSRGNESSPDVSIAHQAQLGNVTWEVTYNDPSGSDHLPIILNVRTSPPKAKRISKKRRKKNPTWSHSKANWELFAHCLDQELGDENSKPPQEMNIHELSQKLIDAYCSAGKVAIPRGNRPNAKVFWNQECEEACKNRDNARKESKTSEEKAKVYQLLRKEADTIIVDSKTNKIREFTSNLDLKTEPAKVWGFLGALDENKKRSKPGTSLKFIDKTSGNEITANTDKEKADLLIRTYYQSGKLELNKHRDLHVKREERKVLRNCKGCANTKVGMCCPYNMSELNMALASIKNGKSPGPDTISNEMLKHSSDGAKELILNLFNKSWAEAICPKDWKTAEIITIPKPGKDTTNTESFRPISLLSTMSKLMEKVVQCRFQYFLEKEDKLTVNQAGFRKGRSCTEQVSRIIQTIYDGFQTKPSTRTLVTYIDFTKAYDKVWRSKLYVKMDKMGFPACATRWVRSLMSDRYSYVKWRGTKSNKRRFDFGVPQGSVLAPLLWLIYVNDILEDLPPEERELIMISLFADDIALIVQGVTLQICEEKMQRLLNVVEKWAETNKVEISLNKTQCCFYTKDTHEVNKKVPTLTLQNTPLKHNNTPKFLGTYLDQQLLFKKQADEMAAKMEKRNRILRSLAGRTWGQKKDTLRQLYISYNLAAADYNLAAWGPAAPPSTLDILEKKQNVAARIITGCAPDTPIIPLLAEAGLMKIKDRVAIQSTLQHERTVRLPGDIPSKITAERTNVKLKFAEFKKPEKNMLPPREMATSLLIKMGLDKIQREDAVRHPTVAPWDWGDLSSTSVNINTELEGCSGRHDTPENKERAFSNILHNVNKEDTIIYSDGSVKEGTEQGGAGILVIWPGGEKERLAVPAGGKCSSYKAEFTAIETALATVEHRMQAVNSALYDSEQKSKIWLFTDSQSALERLQMGPGNQNNKSGDRTWKILIHNQDRIDVTLQWIPGHSNIEGNEIADEIAKEACDLDQTNVPIGLPTTKAVIKRWVKANWEEEIKQTDTFYNRTTGGKSRNVPGLSRKDDILIAQLKTGKTPVVRACLAFYKKKDRNERMCTECGVVEDVEHLLLTCRQWGRERQIHLGTNPTLKILNDDPVMVLEYMRAIGRTAAPAL